MDILLWGYFLLDNQFSLKHTAHASMLMDQPARLTRIGADMLELSNINKSFGGVKAVRAISMTCKSGEIMGLIGPNGAGKSTLVNIASGASEPDSGRVTIDGVELTGKGPEFAAYAGIGRTFQNLRLFPSLTVRQNINVALTTARKVRPAKTAMLDIDQELRLMGLHKLSDTEAGTLSYGDQRRVEILRALALCPSVMLLDEPAAGMNDIESAELSKEIKRIRDCYGCGVIAIDHDLKFIMGLCELITVMDMGEIIAVGPTESVCNNPRVIEVYLGSYKRDQE